MAKKGMKFLNNATLVLLSVGGVNWLLTKLMDFDLVSKVAEAVNMPEVGTVIYSLVGISGIYIGILALMGKITIK